MHQPRLAPERQQILVAHDVGDAGVDAPLDLVGQPAPDQLLAEFGELRLVDRRLLVGEDEEAHLMVVHQPLDLVDHLLRVAHPVVAPEFPLRAERAGEGTAPRHVRDRHPGAERHVDVFRPFEDRPVRIDAVEILHRARRLGRHDLVAVAEGQPVDLAAVLQIAALVDGADQVDDDLLALAAHDHVDLRRLRQHLLVHEGRMHAAQHPHRLRHRLAGDLEHALGLVDRRRDRGHPHHVGLQRDHPLGEFLVGQIVGHRVDERHLIVARRLQRAGEIRDPGRRPVAGDLGAAGMVVRVNEEDVHRSVSGVTVQIKLHRKAST